MWGDARLPHCRGFFSCLSEDGSVYDDTKYVWMQGRQVGRMWGSSLFQSPEEYRLGAAIDELTNVYTAGAFAFVLFGRYRRGRESWELSDSLYAAALRAVNDDRARRQPSLRALREEWETALAYRAK